MVGSSPDESGVADGGEGGVSADGPPTLTAWANLRFSIPRFQGELEPLKSDSDFNHLEIPNQKSSVCPSREGWRLHQHQSSPTTTLERCAEKLATGKLENGKIGAILTTFEKLLVLNFSKVDKMAPISQFSIISRGQLLCTAL